MMKGLYNVGVVSYFSLEMRVIILASVGTYENYMYELRDCKSQDIMSVGMSSTGIKAFDLTD